MDKIVCKKCGTELNEAQGNFGTRIVNGKRYFRHVCKSCWTGYATEHRSNKASKRRNKKRFDQVAVQREAGAARHVLRDCRGWDKKHGFTPDPELTKKFVEDLLQQGCQYCEATHEQIRIALDRIDNRLGHGAKNVNPACVRCNLTRGNMPYAAWLEVVPGMRQAREKGLFGMWVPGNRAKRN